MKSPSAKRLKEIVYNFNSAKVLVVGDLILDEFLWGEVSRISPEAPVPVVEVERESFMPGGAANVANNICSLGGKAVLIGAIGKDQRGKILTRELKAKGVDVSGVIVDPRRPTTLKTRIIARHQQVVRVDRENTDHIGSELSAEILNFVKERAVSIDNLLIEDYGKGMITPPLIKGLVDIAKKNGIIVTVDPKRGHFLYYRGVTVITPNREEAGWATGIGIDDRRSLRRAGAKLLEDLRCRAVLITLGEEGMCLFEAGGKVTHIPTFAQEVFDVTGAGDTVIAAFSLALASGARPIDAAYICNYTAGIVVGKLGVAVSTRDELLERIGESE